MIKDMTYYMEFQSVAVSKGICLRVPGDLD